MGIWHDVDGQRIQLLADGSILWEHDCPPSYQVPRHMVGAADGARWTGGGDPLTLSPSLHCDPSRGGCGLHGFVTDGHWG